MSADPTAVNHSPSTAATHVGNDYEKGHLNRFHAYDNTQPGFPVHNRRIANPGPLGLLAFATSTWLISLFLVQARHVYIANLALAMSLAAGGLVQILASMWEFPSGNTYGATMFGILGAFYLSLGILYWPESGIQSVYSGTNQGNDALGLYLSAWFILSVIMLIASIRTSAAMTVLWFAIFMTFILALSGTLREEEKVLKASGGFGIFTSAVAFYLGAAGLWTKEAAYFNLPVGQLSGRRTVASNV